MKRGDFMATYAISDIHGEYDKFIELLNIINLKEEDSMGKLN